MRPGSAEASGPAAHVEDDDTVGPYAWPTRAVGERRTQQHLDALHVRSEQGEGEGADRRLAAGLRFALSGHASVAASTAFAPACACITTRATTWAPTCMIWLDSDIVPSAAVKLSYWPDKQHNPDIELPNAGGKLFSFTAKDKEAKEENP